MSIPERYMASGAPVDGGERVTGQRLDICYTTYIVRGGFTAVGDILCINDYVEVDPDTIEPVKAEPIRTDVDHEDYFTAVFRCPECEKILLDYDYGRAKLGIYQSRALKRPRYCDQCGMALGRENDKNE